MKITCPECGVSGTLDDTHAGRKIRCPKCKALFAAGESAAVAVVRRTDVGTSLPAEPQDADGDSATEKGQAEHRREQDDAVADNTQAPAEEDVVVPPVSSPRQQATGADDEGVGNENIVEKSDDATADFQSMRIGDLISRSWELTAGVKGPIWGGFAVMYGIMMVVVAIIAGLILSVDLDPEGLVATLLDLANSALSTVLTAGLMYMGVKRAAGRTVVWRDIFAAFPMGGQIIVAMVLQGILILIGFLLLVLPGIYLAVGYGMTFALMVDRSMTPWQAMEASRKAIHKVWWKVFGLYLITMLIIMISAIPMGVGLIWTMPMSIVLYGVVYAGLFREKEVAGGGRL